MPKSRQALRRILRGAERVAGRRNVARAARFLWMEACLDGPNSIQVNGELLVQASLNGADGPVAVLDVGAHFGEWTASLLQQVPRDDLTVTCFEPSAYTFRRLRAELAGNDDRAPRLERIALGAREGTARLKIVHQGAGSNSLVTFAADRDVGLEEVAVSTIDDYCARRRLKHVALLKIDAEGSDMNVMRGATSMLTEQRIELLQFEYNHRWIHARCYLKDAFDLLEPHGYSIGKVTRKGIEEYSTWHEDLESFREGNYLAYLPSWRAQLSVFPWWNASA